MLNDRRISHLSQFVLVAILLTGFAPAQSTPLFTSGSISSVASLPLAITNGDFNGDGVQDAAVTSSGTNAVSILLGAGDGSFEAAVNYPVGIDPVAIVAGDFNRDGHLDLAVVDSNPNTGGANGSVSILLGQGDGTFVAGTTYSSGLVPSAIALGDFDGDGNLDLVVVVGNPNLFFNPGYVTVMLGAGDGTFPNQNSYNVGIAPVSIVTGDFNGDGQLDLAVGSTLTSFFNPQSEVSVLLNSGSGTFQNGASFIVGQTGTVPICIAAADFNLDGRLDLAMAVSNTSQLLVAQGNGDGTFTTLTAPVVGNNPIWLAASDINGDGKPDLAVANNYDNTVSILIGDGDQTFNLIHTYPVGGHPTNLSLTDLNGDGNLDVDVVNNADSTAQALLGKGNGSFQSGPYSVPKGATGLTSGDFNGDRIPDLAVYNADGSISIFLADGQGGFHLSAPFAACSATAPFITGAITSGDYNGDGKIDLAGGCESIGGEYDPITYILSGNGDATFQLSFTTQVPPGGVATADLNGDGVAEFIYSYASNILFTDLVGFSGGLNNSVVPGAIGVESGDFNGDGKADLISTTTVAADGDIPLLGDGQGNFQAFPPAAVGTSLTVADFNGDGFSDFAFSNNSVQVELSDGDGAFKNGYTIPCCGLASGIGDFNGDGIPDIVSLQVPGYNGADVYLGQLDGSFVGSSTSLPYSSTSLIAVGDFDNNGSPDLAVLDPASGLLNILLNTHSFQASSTSLSKSSSTVVAGQQFALIANVSSSQGAPTGVVTFKQAGVAQTTAALASGTAQVTETAPSATGQYGYTALYTGDGTFSGSLSQRLLVNVTAASSTTVVSSSDKNSNLGQNVILTATVNPEYSGVPTGTVQFFADGQPIGTGPMSNGQASVSISSLSQGNHTIEADYSGDASFTTSIGLFTQRVGKASSTVTLASSLNPAAYGQAVTLTATVTDSAGVAPTGTVVFSEGATIYGSITLNSGAAQLTLPQLPAGKHKITAQYSGDGSDNPSKATLTETIQGASSTTAIASSLNPSNYGEAVIFTATVTSTAGIPDGTVTFKNGTQALGTVTLSGGQAQLSVTTIDAGARTIKAVYNGSSNFATSQNSLQQVVVAAATTLTLSASPNPASLGQSVTFTATVGCSTAVPTGTVTFKEGKTVLGTASVVNGEAQFTTATLSSGTHNITATFKGSPDFAASTSSPLQEVIN